MYYEGRNIEVYTQIVKRYHTYQVPWKLPPRRHDEELITVSVMALSMCLIWKYGASASHSPHEVCVSRPKARSLE